MNRTLRIVCACVMMTGLMVGSVAAAECPWDVVGLTDPTPPISAASFAPDGQVTFDYYLPQWWQDDTMACYYSYQNPAYLYYFPGCDPNGDGLVAQQELLDIYYYAIQTPIAGTNAYATPCPVEPEYTCDDLTGVDFGSCPAPIGAAIVDGTCKMIFGCEAPAGIKLFANVAECQMLCSGCETNDVCAAGEYYHCPISGQCGMEIPVEPHGCEVMPEACYLIYNPVCGCDGQTYGNDCEAAMHGTSIWHMGPCA